MKIRLEENILEHLKQHLYQVEPELTFIEYFPIASSYVFKVSISGRHFILKDFRTDYYGAFRIVPEEEVLERAKDVKEITHLVKKYPILSKRSSILKEYFEGDEANLNTARPLNFRRRLRELVSNLHDLGICSIDIKPKNIIISPDSSDFRLVDLNFCKFREHLTEEDYEAKKQRELDKCNNVFYG